MSIEIISVPGPRRRASELATVSLRAILFRLRDHLAFRAAVCLLVVGLVVGVDTLLRSYRYYSSIIDARLATGYLTARPGLYAAPRVLQPNQRMTVDELQAILRRAGYVESVTSKATNGTFARTGNTIEITPNVSLVEEPGVVRIKVEGFSISSLELDEQPIDSFTLQPEILSNDPSTKSGEHETLTYGEIPPVLVHAILSIEDQRFFQHSGIDLNGLGRALFRNLVEEHWEQGGSTITQQLVKNTYLTPERTFRRKYAEAMLAVSLERRLSKKEIFALYCNEIYLGQRGAVAIRGVKQAARMLFARDLKDLTLPQAATIAGMIQGPARYSPQRRPEQAAGRRNLVLDAMQRDSWISKREAEAAEKEQLCVLPLSESERTVAPYFVDYVNRVAEAELDTSGATDRIYTTVDLELQQFAEDSLKHQLDRLDRLYENRGAQPQAALVALDPKTGNVLAMVGGRNYAESQLNRATDARRQPGSIFKPFVYAAALEDGMSEVQSFADTPREFVYDHNQVYRPANFGGGYSMSYVTMRTGLVKSLNVVTVDVAMQTGLARIANLAERFGLPKPQRYPSLALGTSEATPLQMAAAYGAFVNDGRRVQPRVITSIGTPPGTHRLEGEADQVIKPTTAYMVTNMLSAVIERGTARAARRAVKGVAIAGKTGTSRDGWFVGYTPNLVCAVWIGFDDNQQLGLTGAEAALPAWAEFMQNAVAYQPNLGGSNFECPEGINFVEIDTDTGLLSTLSCPNRELIAVTERAGPNLECYFHGNLPAPTSPFGEETETAVETIRSKQPRAVPQSALQLTAFSRSTRVDVDMRGRKTLVNEMR
ncbi:MAG: PBP1A family penicillin-binding protein [Pyrinomonadaceae bacterium]